MHVVIDGMEVEGATSATIHEEVDTNDLYWGMQKYTAIEGVRRRIILDVHGPFNYPVTAPENVTFIITTKQELDRLKEEKKWSNRLRRMFSHGRALLTTPPGTRPQH